MLACRHFSLGIASLEIIRKDYPLRELLEGKTLDQLYIESGRGSDSVFEKRQRATHLTKSQEINKMD